MLYLIVCLSITNNTLIYKSFLCVLGAYSLDQMSDDEDMESQNRQGTSVSLTFVASNISDTV